MRYRQSYLGKDGNYYKCKKLLDLSNKVEELWGILVNQIDLPKYIQNEYLCQYEFYFKKMQKWKMGNTHTMQTRSKSRSIPFRCGSC